MDVNTTGKFSKKQAWESTALGLLAIAAGLSILLDLAGAASRMPKILGLAAILSGCLYAVSFIRDLAGDRKGKTTPTKALVFVAVGVLLFFKQEAVIPYLLLAAGLFFIVISLVTTFLALVMRAFSKGFFWILFVIALLIFIIGLIVLIAPTALGVPAETLIGTGLLLTGLLNFSKASGGSIVKLKGKAEAYDPEEEDESPQ